MNRIGGQLGEGQRKKRILIFSIGSGIVTLLVLFTSSFVANRLMNPSQALHGAGRPEAPKEIRATSIASNYGSLREVDGRAVKSTASVDASNASEDTMSKACLAYARYKGAINRLARAQTYRLVSLHKNLGANKVTVETSLMLRSPDGECKYRKDVDICDAATGQLLQGVTRCITNERGTFLMRNLPGSTDVAFLLDDSASPAREFHQNMTSIANLVDVKESEVSEFSMDSVDLWGRPVDRVSMPAVGTAASEAGVLAYAIYVDRGTGLIRRYEATGADNNVLMYVEYSAVSVDEYIDPSLFVLPGGAQIVSASSAQESLAISQDLMR